MGQDTLVREQLENGRKLIDSVIAEGFDVDLAFWIKETEADNWFLYLSSPFVDQQGLFASYMLVQAVIRRMPELDIDPSEVRVVSLNDSRSVEAREAIRYRMEHGLFPLPNAPISQRVSRFGGVSLGGRSINGGYIYLPTQPVAST